MPPAAVLGLQLIVAIAVGAHPLVLLLIALSTFGVLVAVRRARQLAPKTVPEEDVRFTSRVVGPVVLDAGANGDAQDPVAGERRSMDLRWVAATILPAGSSPDDPTPPRTHG